MQLVYSALARRLKHRNESENRWKLVVLVWHDVIHKQMVIALHISDGPVLLRYVNYVQLQSFACNKEIGCATKTVEVGKRRSQNRC